MICVLVFCCIVGMHHMASGQSHECRTLRSVANSAVSVAANSAGGGHVWKHVADLGRVPANAGHTESQEGKTMFASEEDFISVWAAFQSAVYKPGVMSKPEECFNKADGQNDCVLAKDVGITDAYICRAVDRTTKLCTDMEKIKPKFVVFYYDKGPRALWHLNTAYPAGSNPGAGSCVNLYQYVEDDERRDAYGRRGGRRESRHHRARHGAECITKIIKLFTKQIINLNTKDN